MSELEDQTVAVVQRYGRQLPFKSKKQQQQKKKKKKQPALLKWQLEEMKLSGDSFMFALATVVLVAAVCVAPRAALSNGKYHWSKPSIGLAFGYQHKHS